MATLDQIKGKMQSSRRMHSIVRTMKSLAAVNVRRYMKASNTVADHEHIVHRGLSLYFSARGGPSRDEPEPELPSPFVLVIAIGSDLGMCGPFNERTARRMVRVLDEYSDRTVFVTVVGARLAAGAEFESDTVLANAASIQDVSRVVGKLLEVVDERRAGIADMEVLLVSNSPTGKASYETRVTQLLPVRRYVIAPPDSQRSVPRRGNSIPLILGQPLRRLLRDLLVSGLSRAILGSLAAENAARLAAMEAAVRNVEDRLDELGRLFNRSRQQAITGELLDIASGYEALRGG